MSMKHLDISEIEAFVSINAFDAQSVEMSRVVNGHISECGECREKVRAMQKVYDALCSEGKKQTLELDLKKNKNKSIEI